MDTSANLKQVLKTLKRKWKQNKKKRRNSKLGSTVGSEPLLKIVNEYDQEIPQSQTADNPVAP